MTFRSMAALAVLAAVIATGSGAWAADNDDSAAYAKRIFAGSLPTKGKSFACFVRRYDALHLASHPRQKVNAMKILVTAEILPEDDALNYSFQLATSFRGQTGNFDSSGSCGHPLVSEDLGGKMQLGCGVDCDGGGVSIELANADKSVLVHIERIAIWRSDKPDAERTSLEGGADDRVFRLDRVGLDECQSLINNLEEPATLTQ